MLSYRIIKSILSVLMLLVVSVDAMAEYHGKHLILAVDQTPDVVNSSDMNQMYQSLSAFLRGDDALAGMNKAESQQAGDFKLEPGDRVTILGFGLQLHKDADESTTGNISGYGIHDKVPYTDSKRLARELFNGLIHPLYDGTVEDVDKFVNSTLKDACYGNTAIARKIQDKNGVTLSHYVYPMVLDYVNFDEPSKEYNYLVLSNFKSGTTSQNTSEDRTRLSEILGGSQRHIDAVLAMVNEKAEPFFTVDFLKLATNANNLVLLGKKVFLVQQMGTSVYMKSNLEMEQRQYGGKSFDISPVDISFVKDGSLDIDRVQLDITSASGDLLYTGFPSGGRYDEAEREYKLPAWVFDSPVALEPGDELKFQYVFYATPHTKTGDATMPYAYVVERDMKLTKDNFITQSDTMSYLTTICIVAFLCIAGFVAWRIYVSRGKKALKDLQFHIWPISHTRYMDVKDNRVENYDCWYFRPNDREKFIQVDGDIDVEYPSFAQRYSLIAEYEVQDIDFNDDFSFRPEGFNHDHTAREANKWYPLSLTADGHFDTRVVAYIEDKVGTPNYQRDDHNVLQLQVNVRARLVDKAGKTVAELPIKTSKYNFIVRPEIPNSSLWMAFDPGTSGSCVAYGYGGLPPQTNNIHLARNLTTVTGGKQIETPIFFSKIRILDRSRLFEGVKVEDLRVSTDEQPGDFLFGNDAHIRWNGGRNGFQSIKKLLGYTNELDVEGADGKVVKIKGEDLAHLLVKGLCHEFGRYIATDKNMSDDVRRRLVADDGTLTPSRAIVAVPNNYTVNKIQAMVDTVKRTGLFKEVHFIYEAEAVMMYYFNLNWDKLVNLTNKTFVVFDMGGATINATAFRMRVHTDTGGAGTKYIRSIEVDTVSRVGYTVGGDNIDFALIKVLYGMPSMISALANAGISETEHQRRNKKSLITFVQKLKIDHIRATAGDRDSSNWASNPEVFWTNLFKNAKEWGITLPSAMTDADKTYFAKESKSESSNMKRLVIESVTDAVDELLHGMSASDVELILSGRSVLYPGISAAVTKKILSMGSKVNEWKYEGSREGRDEAVKTAVVRGACWYAMFSSFVNLRHDKLTSTFGYLDMLDNKVSYVPILEKNTPFGYDGALEAEVKPMYPYINNVQFLQMLGRNYNQIVEKEIYHKMNELAQVTSGQLAGQVLSVKIRVDYNNNFTYEIMVAGESEPIKGRGHAVDGEITDRNSEAYSFAALSTLDDNQGAGEEDPAAKKPAGARPATVRPATARPATARPATARPATEPKTESPEDSAEEPKSTPKKKRF